MIVKNDLILNLSPKIRSKTLGKGSKAGFMLSCQFDIICQSDPLAASVVLFNSSIRSVFLINL